MLPMVLYASLLPLHPVMQISKQVRRLDGVRQAQEDMYEAPGPRAMSVVRALVAPVDEVVQTGGWAAVKGQQARLLGLWQPSLLFVPPQL